jgi:hypothetical protein
VLTDLYRPCMRSGLLFAAVGSVVGLLLIAEVAYHTGTVPLGRTTDGVQAVTGVTVFGASAGTLIVMLAIRRQIRTRVLIAVAVVALIVVLGMPYLERAMVGPDPGFVIRTFAAFEWSPVARFVLFPALRGGSAFVGIAVALGVALQLARPAAGPADA